MSEHSLLKLFNEAKTLDSHKIKEAIPLRGHPTIFYRTLMSSFCLKELRDLNFSSEAKASSSLSIT